jgi:predicted AAA+ superfamily ATPase
LTSTVLLLDEVQRLDNWALALKQVVDQDWYGPSGAPLPPPRLVLTGSASALLGRGGQEAGVGRWDEEILEPWPLREVLRLASQGSAEPASVLREQPALLARYLSNGGFPEHCLAEDHARVRARLRAEIADRAIVRDLLPFRVDVARVARFFAWLAAESGSILDIGDRARDLGADERTVREWLHLLVEARLLVEVVRHGHNARARLSSHSRLYAIDHGLVAAFAPLARPGEDGPTWGRMLETAVLRHLRPLARESDLRLSFLRTRSGVLEVDFVLEGSGPPVLIEVKASARPQPADVARLRRAGAWLGTGRLLLVHDGVAPSRHDGVRCLPVGRVLLDPETVLEE